MYEYVLASHQRTMDKWRQLTLTCIMSHSKVYVQSVDRLSLLEEYIHGMYCTCTEETEVDTALRITSLIVQLTFNALLTICNSYKFVAYIVYGRHAAMPGGRIIVCFNCGHA
jgi:hypothetical protein